MHRIAIAFLIFTGSAFGGQFFNPRAVGPFLTQSDIYAQYEYFINSAAGDEIQVFIAIQDGKTKNTIRISPASAQTIARAVEKAIGEGANEWSFPFEQGTCVYRMGNEQSLLEITLNEGNKRVMFNGGDISVFAENCKNAVETSMSWPSKNLGIKPEVITKEVIREVVKTIPAPTLRPTAAPVASKANGKSEENYGTGVAALCAVLASGCAYFYFKSRSESKKMDEAISAIKGRSEQALAFSEKLRAEETSTANAKISRLENKLASEKGQYEDKIYNITYEAKENSVIFANTILDLVKSHDNNSFISFASNADELEKEYGFTSSGEAYKKAKKATRDLIKSQNAVLCGHAQPPKYSALASEFILSAFNDGFIKIQNQVTGGNYLQAKMAIKDLFHSLNSYGRALFDTQLTDDYFYAREKELKSLNVLRGIKERDRAEQKELREQMKDEEKARREYEKVIRDAQRQKEANAREEAELKARVEYAVGEEKAKYEAMLSSLRQRLQDSEEKELRAKSLAEFTKKGSVYIISNIGSFGGEVFKIGMTRRLFPEDRVNELSNASVPFPFDIHAIIESDDAPALESEMHREFNDCRLNKVNARKEFFRVSIGDIKDFLGNHGIDLQKAKFTMKAEAQQYRESVAIDGLPPMQREEIMHTVLVEDENNISFGGNDEDDDAAD